MIPSGVLSGRRKKAMGELELTDGFMTLAQKSF